MAVPVDPSQARYIKPEDFFFAVVAAWGICLFCFFGLWHALNRLLAVKNTPRSLIRSAAQGYVELQGRAKMMPGDPILAPLTGKQCVWWRYSVRAQSRNRGSWNTLTGAEGDISNSIFVLEDSTGQCVVDPEHSSVVPSVKEVWYGNSPDPVGGPEMGSFALFASYRYTEERIEIEDPLCALGFFHTQDPVSAATLDEEVRLQLADWKKDQTWLLQHFDKNHDGQVDIQEWEAARQEARRLVLARESENMKRPPVNVLGRPHDGRSFLISAYPREKLERRLRLRALLCLLGFFLGGALGVYLIQVRFF